MQTDAKLKRAEELNRKLAQELRDLKDRAESLSKKKKTEKKANEFLEDFSKIFDDDVSLIGGSRTGHMFAGPAGDFFGGSSDPVQEYEFKINLLENDLQSVQSENNTLVKSLLQLKQQVREKKAAHDEVSTKLLLQKSSELKREIADADAVQAKLEAKVEELRKKIQQNSDFTQQRHSEEGFEAIQRDIQLLEKSNSKVMAELRDLTDKNKSKKKYIDQTKLQKVADRAAAFSKLEQENVLFNELRSRHLQLASELRDLESGKKDQSSIIEEGSTVSREHIAHLRETNERLMNEIIRLNGMLKEQKLQINLNKTKMGDSLSLSQIKPADQSFDKSFISKF